MGKLTTYTIMMMGLIVLFYFTGLIIDCTKEDGSSCTGDEECLCTAETPNSLVLNLMLKPHNIRVSTIRNKGILILEGITAAALLGVSFLYRDVKLALLGPFAIYIFNLLYDFTTVTAKIWSIHPLLSVIVALILSPLLVYYIIAVVEWWGGTD